MFLLLDSWGELDPNENPEELVLVDDGEAGAGAPNENLGEELFLFVDSCVGELDPNENPGELVLVDDGEAGVGAPNENLGEELFLFVDSWGELDPNENPGELEDENTEVFADGRDAAPNGDGDGAVPNENPGEAVEVVGVLEEFC